MGRALAGLQPVDDRHRQPAAYPRQRQSHRMHRAGEADERLLRAAESLASGQPPPAPSLATLLTWGSTSGANALLGMALATRP
jgi:hypothetical protein